MDTPSATAAAATAIQPLPAGVVAQIKASTAIVSLADVVLELLKNSLDARATRIEAAVDFARGACTVDDDGLGIPPLEFGQDGGLGRRYCTSKHTSPEPLLGRHGIFLASLAAVSLVSITSRHHQHRSTNSLTFHHAKTVRRQQPVSSHFEIRANHGTHVTVRNLFGNLPVRVKLRSKVAERKSDQGRLWEALKARVAALLLSWAGSVSLQVRDAQNRICFAFNTSNSWLATRHKDLTDTGPPSPHLTPILAVLTQANYLSASQWPTWIPVSASTPLLSIKGAISLEPAPTSSIQFISLGIRPLTADSDSNELYSQVNRLFRHSSFGVEEDFDDPQRPSRPRKGIDRHPMFHLRIAFRKHTPTTHAEDELSSGGANLQVVVEVLGAMVVQWLEAHQFRPVLARPKRDTSHEPSLKDVDPVHSTKLSLDAAATPIRKRKRLGPSDHNVKKPANRAFAEWSRIKSAKADHFSIPATFHESTTRAGAMSLQSKGDLDSELSLVGSNSARPAGFDTQPLARGSLSTSTPSRDGPVNSTTSEDDKPDESLVWVDPTMKKPYLLHARTGCVVPLSRTHTATPTHESPILIPHALPRPSLRLAPKTAPVRQTPWLDRILQTWTNPVFRTSEPRIEQISPQDDKRNDLHDQCCSALKDKTQNAQVPTLTRLSKECLMAAEVMSQVDKKFILVKTTSCTNGHSDHDASRPLLVLIDQHAADERIRVEALLRELCSPMPAHCFGYRSKLGHRALVRSVMLENPVKFAISRQERLHFTTYASRFADWGILFDFADTATAPEKVPSLEDASRLLCVAALPPSISERCQSDTQLLISFLRSAVWTYASDLTPLVEISTPHGEPPSWIERLIHCPEGLVDMINSRACRSAIMFNDELSMNQCRGLVKSLARCAFPFVCAHGRPSMVPLGDVGSFTDATQTFSSCLHVDKGSFVNAWKQWAH